jgi:hypothetical protein
MLTGNDFKTHIALGVPSDVGIVEASTVYASADVGNGAGAVRHDGLDDRLGAIRSTDTAGSNWPGYPMSAIKACERDALVGRTAVVRCLL